MFLYQGSYKAPNFASSGESLRLYIQFTESSIYTFKVFRQFFLSCKKLVSSYYTIYKVSPGTQGTRILDSTKKTLIQSNCLGGSLKGFISNENLIGGDKSIVT